MQDRFRKTLVSFVSCFQRENVFRWLRADLIVKTFRVRLYRLEELLNDF